MRVALITGTSTGIGLETALHLAEHGYRVFASARNPATSEGLRAAGDKLETLTLDVDDDASVERAVGETLENAGRIDVLVNNAGIGGGGPIEAVPLEAAKQTFETNYFGAIRMIRAVVPQMRGRRSGAVVNVTSVAGRVVLAAHSHYAASKFALEAASESLAQELAPYGVRVAIVEPGVVLTPIFAKGGSRDLDPATPSAAAIRRLWALMGAQLQNPTLPIACAEAIRRAIEDPEPRLRHPVGRDAILYLAGRARLSDEEWVAASAIEDDEAFFDRMREAFGADLYRRSRTTRTEDRHDPKTIVRSGGGPGRADAAAADARPTRRGGRRPCRSRGPPIGRDRASASRPQRRQRHRRLAGPRLPSEPHGDAPGTARAGDLEPTQPRTVEPK